MAVLSSSKIARALNAFIKTQIWEESKRIIKAQHEILLTDMAEHMLNNLLEHYHDEAGTARVIQEHRNLLICYRRESVETTFADHLLLRVLLNRINNLADSEAFPEKVEAYRAALGQATHNEDEPLWAVLHTGLAVSLAQNPLVELVENPEQIISHFHQASEGYTRDNSTQQWAQIQFYFEQAYFRVSCCHPS